MSTEVERVERLETAAIDAHARHETWGDFWRKHNGAMAAAEPFDLRKYHKLRGRLLHLVLCGESSGQFAVGDNDAQPWEADESVVP